MADLKREVDAFFQERESDATRGHQSEAVQFVQTTVVPAFEELKIELERHGRGVVITVDGHHSLSAHIQVFYNRQQEFDYTLQVDPDKPLPTALTHEAPRHDLARIPVVRAGEVNRSGTITDQHDFCPTSGATAFKEITREDVHADFLKRYRQATSRRGR